MPKVSIYLPDKLYQEARDHDLPLSSVAQQAIEHALAEVRTGDWIARVRARQPRCHRRVDTSALLDSVREDFAR